MSGRGENDLLRRALALYAGEHVVARVVSEGESFLSPNSRSVEMTMLFLDVASFTAPLKQLTPEVLREWSIAYAETITGTIARAKGTFDTFIGDAASAWWTDDDADHPTMAVGCARQLLGAIEHLNASRQERFPSIRLMIGVHTGRVSLGNIGSSTRLRYCPTGDAVNLASRLCGLCNTYGTPIVISDGTYRRLKDRHGIERLGPVTSKGSAAPLEIYGLRSN